MSSYTAPLLVALVIFAGWYGARLYIRWYTRHLDPRQIATNLDSKLDLLEATAAAIRSAHGEIVLTIASGSRDVTQAMESIFGSANVSEARNFTGSNEVSAHFDASAESIGQVLDLVRTTRQTIGKATLIIGKDKIELSDLPQIDESALLEHPVFKRLTPAPAAPVG